MKKEKLSPQEYVETGYELKTINEKLLALLAFFDRRIGRTKEPYLTVVKAHKLMMTARSEMEEMFYHEHHSLALSLLRSHFGPTTLRPYLEEAKAENIKKFERTENDS